jgi:hypothetical protein
MTTQQFILYFLILLAAYFVIKSVMSKKKTKDYTRLIWRK